jgi:hypothetical protein
MSVFARSLPFVLASLLGLVVGCSCGPDGIAELIESSGTVDRDDAPVGETWRTTTVGESYTWDEAVRTTDGTASLRLGASSGIRMRPNTIIRFLRQGNSPQAGVRVENGEVELESREAMTLMTRAGAVLLEAGTTLRLVAGSADRLEVIAGRAILEGGTTVEAGRAVFLEAGSVVFDDGQPDAGPVAVDAFADDAFADDAYIEADAGPLPTGGNDDEARLEPSPGRAHIDLAAGETVTIHDMAPPTAVRFNLPAACTGMSTVTLAGGGEPVRYAGSGSIIAAVPSGRFRYTFRCGGGQASGGAVTVRRDDGSLRLESVAPRNLFDADGRTYDVLYQNALPIVTFRWAGGGAGPFFIEQETNGRTRSVTSPTNSHTFESGQLRDGDHRLTYVAGTRRSQTTRVRVRFDNAAPTAHIREPRGNVARGAVHVQGQAIEGASVSVGGSPLALDGDNRFEGDTTVPAELDALAIRFSHPRSGVHYYLRRVQ